MTELSGTLEGVGLPAIIRFLTGLKKTGCLRIVHDDWHGEVAFEAGQVTGASLGSRHGLSALDGLVEALSGGSFAFDTSGRPEGPHNIDLSSEALQTHLEALVARIGRGEPGLPSVDSVPGLVAQQDSGSEDPLPLDRGTLQTLLAVDGRRSVREIVALRGTFDALWQLGSLADVGLVRLGSARAPGVPMAPPSAVEPAGVSRAAPAEPPLAAEHCPKLGFEDDPGNSFGRPTRLHRCFAAGTPLPLSLDQQRELCLSDQYGTCPRLTAVIGRGAARPAANPPASVGPTPRSIGNTAHAVGMGERSAAPDTQPEAEDPRIVRLPFAGRNPAAARGGERQTAGASEPTQLHAPGFAQRPGDPPRPTPLRARIDRANSAASPPPKSDAPVTVQAHAPRPAPRVSARATLDDPSTPRFGGVPVRLIAVGAVAVVALAVIAYLVVPHLSDWFGDSSSDLSEFPNASAVAAGTPVSAFAPRPTPAGGAAASASPASASAESANAVSATAASGASAASAASGASTSVSSAASAASPVAAPAAPTPLPEAAAATAGPIVASQPTPPAPGTLLDERFANNARNWPSNPQATTWLTNGSYHLITREAAKFVAVGVPITDVLQDVIVSATFRKLGGSAEGGGFGIIVRDQSPTPLDGVNQAGQYYVLEVGDKGEVGMWRRDVDHWVDLLAWQHADAVRPGTATNDLVVSAIGNRLTMTVNGTQIATVTDSTLPTGRIGLLAGGDGNQIAVDHLTIQTP